MFGRYIIAALSSQIIKNNLEQKELGSLIRRW